MGEDAAPAANIIACGGSEILAQLLWNRGVRVIGDIEKCLRVGRYIGMPPPAMLYNPQEAEKQETAIRAPEVSVELAEIDESLLRGLYRLAAECVDDPDPVFFCRDVRLVNASAYDLARRHTRLLIEDEHGERLLANWWHLAPALVPRGLGDAIFCLRIDDRMGRLEVRAELVAFNEKEKLEADFSAKSVLPFSVEDWRQEDALLCRVQNLEENVQVWSEGSSPANNKIAGCRRDELVAERPLVIWTCPPSPEVMRTVLRQTQPQRLWLCAAPVPELAKGDFLRELGSLVKAVVARRSGRIHRVELAARLAQTERVVLAGLEILEAMGVVRYRHIEERVLLEQGDGEHRASCKDELLVEMLREVAAYRRYAEEATIEELLQ